MAKDVFLSHSSQDVDAARCLRAALGRIGLTAWIAADDAITARPWAEQIADAVDGARLLVVLISAAANESDHVAREVAMAVGRGLPILPVRLEQLPPAGSLHYLLQLVQRIDAYPEGIDQHADAIAARALSLVTGVREPTVIADGIPRATRRTVTALIATVVESVEIGEQLDPEASRALTGRHFAAITQILDSHGGTVERFIGDSVMAVFGFPVLHEDDALRAVRAAAEIRNTLGALTQELRQKRGLEVVFRVGVNTGEVVAGGASEGQTLVTGDPVNTAARLVQAAGPGEILIGRSTYRLVRDAVAAQPADPIVAKGKDALAAAYRLVSVAPGMEGRSRRLNAPLVGRAREVDRIRKVWEAVVADRTCHLATVLGTAGVGKSRLLTEFLETVGGEATVLKGRCLSYGEGITYWPLREIVHEAAGIDESDSVEEARSKLDTLLWEEGDGERLAPRIASAIGLATEAAAQEEIHWATRKLLEYLALERPVVVLVEDVHWAEPALLDLLEHVADLARDAPLMLLCTARPELLDKRPTWGGGKRNATTVMLEPLPSHATEQLLDALPGGQALPASLRGRILTTAEGNPLYVEEMLGMLMDEGLLVEAGGHWVAMAKLDNLKVPPTVKALLATRIDQLTPTERSIAERGSVVGRVFEQAAVSELTPEISASELVAGLMALVRKELVRPGRSDLVAGEAFRFRHLLIRDAAYEALPKAERADLHERFGDWLEGAASQRLAEYVEIVGYHLEQACRYRIELGESGDHVERLGQRAGALLSQCGKRALDRGDLSAGADLLQRATRLLLSGRLWAEAAIWLAEASSLLGDPQSALGQLDNAIKVARALDDERLEWRARVVRAEARRHEDGAVDRKIAHEAIEVFERSQDTDGLAAAWSYVAFAFVGDPLHSDAGARAFEYAVASGNKHLQGRALVALAGRLTFGPIPCSVALTEGERLLAHVGSNLRASAIVRALLANVVAMGGDFERARQMALEGRRALEELGQTLDAEMVRSLAALFIELPAAGLHTAEEHLRVSLSVLNEIGDNGLLPNVAGALAEVLAMQGQADEAEQFASISSGSAGGQEYDAQIRWRRARARVQAHRGEAAGAEALARSAVQIAAGTDDLNAQGDCLTVLGEVLVASGRAADARSSFEDALTRYVQKENLVSAEATRRLLTDLGAAVAPTG